MIIIFKKQNVCKSLLFIIVIMNETYNILTIIIVSLKHITDFGGHFYFERALIVNTVFIINYFDNMS